VVFALTGLGAVSLPIPYFAISPGSAVDVSGLVEVVDGERFEPEGQIYLTTVRLQHVTLMEAVTGWLDPRVEVVEQEVVLPPQVPTTELDDFNLQQMATSKETALGVAFEALGADAIQGGGAEVVSTLEGSPAEGVLEAGDVIVAVENEEIELHHQLVRIVGDREPGDEISLTYRRDGEGEARTARITLTSAGELLDRREPAPSTPVPHPTGEDQRNRPVLGVTLQTLDLTFDFPLEVRIASERIGGPSAGLAFTLEVLDVLTDGELTGGQRVAATGTIELDGSVGPVGGVAQKTSAVEREGIELFLVPSEGFEAAMSVAGDGLRVEAVEDLDDALRILESIGGDPVRAPAGLVPGA
jgi:Lon-like protease